VVAARTEASARKAVRFIGAGQAQAGVTRQIFGSSTILVSVPDDVIASVADELARNGRRRTARQVGYSHEWGVGCQRAAVRAGLRRGGCFHAPMQTFSGVGVPPLEGKVFAIEGDEIAVRVARGIARALGGTPVASRPR